MKVVQVDVFSYDLPLVRPLRLKDQTLVTRHGYLLRLRSDSGKIGWGEAAPLPGFSQEKAPMVLDELNDLRRLLPNREVPAGLAALTGELRFWPTTRRLTESVSCALEMALLNLIATEQSITLARLLSDHSRESVHLNGLVMNTDAVTERVRALHRDGYRAVKLKVGVNPIEIDIDRTRDAFHELGSNTNLRLDANRAWSYDDACRFAEGITNCKVEYIEEPLADPSRLADFHDRTGLSIALDESTIEIPPDSLSDHPHVSVVVLKPTLLGGFERSVEWARRAKEQKIRVVVSSCFESSVGIAALAQLASAYGSFNTPVGLDTLQWLERDLLLEPLNHAHGRIRVAQAARAASQVDPSAVSEIVDG